jgi:hypothetical protein
MTPTSQWHGFAMPWEVGFLKLPILFEKRTTKIESHEKMSGEKKAGAKFCSQ